MIFKVLVTDGPGTDILVPVTSKSLQYSPEGFADSLVWVPAGTANISVAQILKFFKAEAILGAQVPHQLLASSFPEQKKAAPPLSLGPLRCSPVLSAKDIDFMFSSPTQPKG